MEIKIQFILTLSILSNYFSFGQSSFKVNLVNYSTIEFPERLLLNKTTNGVTQIGYKKDGNYYLVDIEDISNYGNLEIKPSGLEDLYDGILIGFFENKEFKLISKSKFTVQNLIGVEVKYSANSKDLPTTRFKRLLFFNGKIFSIEFWTNEPYKENSKKNKDKYFNSFVISIDKSTLKQYTSN